MTEEEQTVKDAINNYYKLLNNYELSIKKEKSKVRGKKQLPLCIRCKRPVDTLFIKNREHLIIKCGDRKNPCSLNVDIYKGSYYNLKYLKNTYKEELDELKEEIVKQKQDNLFGYVTDKEAIVKYKELMEQYHEDNQLYKELNDKYVSLYENISHQELIASKNAYIFSLIERYKDLLNQYKQTHNKEILKMAIEVNVKEITPELEKLRTLKYKVMEINKNEVKKYKLDDDADIKEYEYTLFTLPVNLIDIDYNIAEKPRVIKYEV